MLQDYSDRELIDLYRESRDYQYLTELFTRHSDIVYRTALRIMQNASDAEDIMQTAYCKLIVELPHYKHTGSVVGWILQMVVNCCFDRLRSEKSRVNREKKYVSERRPVAKKNENDLKEIMENHLNKLPEIYKVPITLQIMEGLSIKEVSEVLQIPEKTIRSQISRGLEKLKTSLQSVGVTASILSIGDMLESIQKKITPAELRSSQYFNEIYQNKSSLYKKPASSLSLKNIILYTSIFVIAASSFIAWSNYSKELSKEKKGPNTATLTKVISEKFDFENMTDSSKYSNLWLKNGAITIVENKGINGSNGLKIDEISAIGLDISKYKLPIKISYVGVIFLPHIDTGKKLDSLQIFLKSNYNKNQKLFFLSHLKEKTVIYLPANFKSKEIFTEKWHSYVGYIAEDYVDFWFEGNRSQYLKGKSYDNKMIYLWTVGRIIIDDLTITSIDNADLPNIEGVENSISLIPVKEINKVYPLDKKSLGISENSTLTPSMNVTNSEYIENEMLGHKVEIGPAIGKNNMVEWQFIK